MSHSEDNLLQQIESRFKELYHEHGDLPLRTLAEVVANPNLLKNDFEKYGFGVIDDALKSGAFERNQEALIKELSWHLFNTDNPFENSDFVAEHQRITEKYPDFSEHDRQMATLTNWWNSENGFGGSNFRFLYLQFADQSPRFQIGSEEIEFSRNPIHRCSLRLMAEHPELWTILKNFHRPEETPMISWDSQKVRFQDSESIKATKPSLTVPHRDTYMNDGVLIDRVQAMLIHQDPEAISLGWVLFSHDPLIQQLSSLLLTKKPDGFTQIKNERLVEIMAPYWRGPRGGFAVWKQETVHYEGEPTPDRHLKAFEQTPQNLCRFSYRAVVGTHIPIGLTPEMRRQLAYLVEQGWCPEIYIKQRPHNKGTNVNMNVVDRKSTMNMVPRLITPTETANLSSLNYTPEGIEQTLSALSPIMREFYGFYE